MKIKMLYTSIYYALFLVVLRVCPCSSNDVITPSVSPRCDHRLIGSLGPIQSPNYPNRYPRGQLCQWFISTNSSDFIKLTVERLALPNSTSERSRDVVSVYVSDPSRADSTAFLRLSGMLPEVQAYSLNSPTAWVRFRSGDNTTRPTKDEFRGFFISVSRYSSSVSCKSLGGLDHGSISAGDVFPLGSIVNFTCDPGYLLIGSNSSECVIVEDYQDWSNPLPTCVPRCDPPSKPGNGELVLSGSTAVFKCSPPYYLEGDSLIICTVSSQGLASWNGSVPNCLIPDCSKTVIFRETSGAFANPSYPQNVLRADRRCTWNILGSTGQVIQFHGFVDLPAGNESFIRFFDVTGGREVAFSTIYRNDTLYNLTSSTNEVTIRYQGPAITTSNTKGFFIKYEMIYPLPTSTLSTVSRPMSTFTLATDSSTLAFTAVPVPSPMPTATTVKPFTPKISSTETPTLSGSSSMTSSVSSTTSTLSTTTQTSTIPQTTPSTTTTEATPSTSTSTSTSRTTSPTTAAFPRTSPTMSPFNPICDRRIFGRTGQIESPSFPDPYPLGINCQWFINTTSVKQIQLQFSQFSLPTRTGGFTREELNCYITDPSLTQTMPTVVFRGRVEPNLIYTFNSSVLWLRFRSSSNNTEIKPGVTWGFSIQYVSVSPVPDCNNPGRPDHGNRSGNSFSLDSLVSYSCDIGYKLIGRKLARCTAGNNGPRWSSAAPTCVASCDSLAVPINGEISGTNTSLHSSSSFKCIAPYLLDGDPLVTCIARDNGGGRWNGTSPTCYLPDCSRPVTLTQTTGEIVNPSFPNLMVIGGKQCSWTVEARLGQVVRFNSEFVDLPADDFSFILFKDVGNSTEELLIRVEGREDIVNVTSNTNIVTIEYRGPRENFTINQGFRIKFQIISAVPSTPTTISTQAPATSMTSAITQSTIAIVTTAETEQTNTPLPPVTSQSTKSPVTLGIVDNGGSDDSVSIALGVTIPLLILFLIAGFLFYKWYRRKYPVRMILGREFSKFENPDYLNRVSTLSLVREDADDYFSRATSKANSTVSLAVRHERDNLAYESDKNYNPSDDDDIVKRKSFLFTKLELDEHHDWMETEFTHSPNGSESSVFESNHVESDKNSEISHQNNATSSNGETTQQNNTTGPNETQHQNDSTSPTEEAEIHLSKEQLHNMKNTKEHSIKDTPIETILTQVRDRRAFTEIGPDDRQGQRGEAILDKGRSRSANALINNNGRVDYDQESSNRITNLNHSISNDELSNRHKEHPINRSAYSLNDKGINNDVSITITDDVNTENDDISSDVNPYEEILTAPSQPGRVSVNSRVSVDSEGKDSLGLVPSDFSDSGSVGDIHIRTKNDSESVTSLRGDSSSSETSHSSRYSSVREVDRTDGVISPERNDIQENQSDSVLSNEVFLTDSDSELGDIKSRKSSSDVNDLSDANFRKVIPDSELQGSHNTLTKTPSISSFSSHASYSASEASYHVVHSDDDVKNPTAHSEDVNSNDVQQFLPVPRVASETKSTNSDDEKQELEEVHKEEVKSKNRKKKKHKRRQSDNSKSSSTSDSSSSSSSSSSDESSSTDEDNDEDASRKIKQSSDVADVDSINLDIPDTPAYGHLGSVQLPIPDDKEDSEEDDETDDGFVVADPLKLENGVTQSAVDLNTSRDSSTSSRKRSIGPDVSFSADTASLNSHALSSVASYNSSDDEGVYVLQPEVSDHYEMDQTNNLPSLPLNDKNGVVENHNHSDSSQNGDIETPGFNIQYRTQEHPPEHPDPHLEQTEEDSNPRDSYHLALDPLNVDPRHLLREELSQLNPQGAALPEGTEEDSQPSLAAPPLLPTRNPNLLLSDSESGDDMFTDEDILRALDEEDDSSIDDLPPPPPVPMGSSSGPRPVAITAHSFKFGDDDDDDDDDIDV